MRRMLVSRSSREKPSPLLRFVRTSSPSRTSMRTPRSRSRGARYSASVDLPAPESPVNQSVNPGVVSAMSPPCDLTPWPPLRGFPSRGARSAMERGKLWSGILLEEGDPAFTVHSSQSPAPCDMQAALDLVGAAPAAGARIFARLYGAGAVGAADARVAAVVQRVVGQLVLDDVCPDLRLAPARERVQLDHVELRVPLHERRLTARARLVTAQTGEIGVEMCQRL